MGGIKITPADRWFSMCVRERTDWTCERCGNQYEYQHRGLHCSHYFGRGSWSVRHVGDNAFAHCFGCHQHLGSNPDEFARWVSNHLGDGAMGILREKWQSVDRGRRAKRGQKELASHYQQQHKLQRQQRLDGVAGRVDFEDWD